MDNYQNAITGSSKWEKLGNLCDVIIGGTPSRKDISYWGGNNLWVKISDMSHGYIDSTQEKITDKGVTESNVKKLEEGTVLFSFKLTIGKVAIAKKELYTNEAIAGIVPKDNRVLSKYLYYILPHVDFTPYIQRATKGKTLNKEIIKTIKIPVPSVIKQIEIIRNLDKKESELQALQDNIEKVKQEQKIYLLESYS